MLLDSELSNRSYSREELLRLRPNDVALARSVRKAIFSHRLWLPSYRRTQRRPQECQQGVPRATPAHTTSHRDRNKRKQHHTQTATATSPQQTRIGLLNAQSVGNKYAAICDRIASERLHFCAIVESWHDATDDPDLIACAPPDYRFQCS